MNGLLMKAGLATAMAATTLTVAAPADAQRYRGYRHHDRGGDVAAGALIGGVIGLGLGAAIASDRGPYYRGGYGGGYYGPNYYGPRYYAPPVVYRPRYYRPRAYYRGYPYRGPRAAYRRGYRW